MKAPEYKSIVTPGTIKFLSDYTHPMKQFKAGSEVTLDISAARMLVINKIAEPVGNWFTWPEAVVEQLQEAEPVDVAMDEPEKEIAIQEYKPKKIKKNGSQLS